MTDYVTQADLESWGRDIFRRMDARMDTVLQQLTVRDSEVHTIALMAAHLYGKGYADPHVIAKQLYRDVQRSLETDRAIVGQIGA